MLPIVIDLFCRICNYFCILGIFYSTSSFLCSVEEMAAGSDEVGKTVAGITAIATQNAAEEMSSAVEEMTASMKEIAASAQRLTEIAATLQAQVGRFKL